MHILQSSIRWPSQSYSFCFPDSTSNCYRAFLKHWPKILALNRYKVVQNIRRQTIYQKTHCRSYHHSSQSAVCSERSTMKSKVRQIFILKTVGKVTRSGSLKSTVKPLSRTKSPNLNACTGHVNIITDVGGPAVPRSRSTHHRCPWVPLTLPRCGGRVTPGSLVTIQEQEYPPAKNNKRPIKLN